VAHERPLQYGDRGNVHATFFIGENFKLKSYLKCCQNISICISNFIIGGIISQPITFKTSFELNICFSPRSMFLWSRRAERVRFNTNFDPSLCFSPRSMIAWSEGHGHYLPYSQLKTSIKTMLNTTPVSSPIGGRQEWILSIHFTLRWIFSL
jgi:hypothetical protein